MPLPSHTPSPHVACDPRVERRVMLTVPALISSSGMSPPVRLSPGPQATARDLRPSCLVSTGCLPSCGSACAGCWIKEKCLMTKGVADFHPVGCFQILVFLSGPRSALFSAVWEVEFLLRSGLKIPIKDSIRKQRKWGGSGERIWQW